MSQADWIEEEEERRKELERLKSIKIGNFPDTENSKEAMEIIQEKLKKLEYENGK